MTEIDREASWRKGELVVKDSWKDNHPPAENIFTQFFTTLHHGFQDLTNSAPPEQRPASFQSPVSSHLRVQNAKTQDNMRDDRSSRSVVSSKPTHDSIRRSKSTPSQIVNTTRDVDTVAGDPKSRICCENCARGMLVPRSARRVRCCHCRHVFVNQDKDSSSKPPGTPPRTPLKPSQPPASASASASPTKATTAASSESRSRSSSSCASKLPTMSSLSPPPGAPRYRLVGPASECIKASLAAQGFVRDDATPDWVLAWGSTLPASQLTQLQPWQRHNHIPGWNLLNNKGVVGRLAERARAKGQSLALTVPVTFVLPEHAAQLAQDSADYAAPYIVKPIGGTRGKGIRLVERVEAEQARKWGRVVVQRYIKNPHLIQGRKYDLRLYVAATSTDPMRIYIHEQGYARFCSEEFDLSKPQDLFRHVTNSGLQKFHSAYDLNNSSTAARAAGSKWHLSAVRAEWRKSGSDQIIWDRIKEAVVRAFVLTEALAVAHTKKTLRHSNTCFCLFGVDVLVDRQLRPWLLELNGLPSTGTDSTLDIAIKTAMVGDLLSLVGLAGRDPGAAQQHAAAHLTSSLAQRQKTSLPPPTTRLPSHPPSRIPTAEEVRAVLSRTLSPVQPQDVEAVLEWEEEKGRRRGWEPLYPSRSMGQYLPLLPYRRSNQAMFAWVTGL